MFAMLISDKDGITTTITYYISTIMNTPEPTTEPQICGEDYTFEDHWMDTIERRDFDYAMYGDVGVSPECRRDQ